MDQREQQVTSWNVGSIVDFVLSPPQTQYTPMGAAPWSPPLRPSSHMEFDEGFSSLNTLSTEPSKTNREMREVNTEMKTVPKKLRGSIDKITTGKDVNIKKRHHPNELTDEIKKAKLEATLEVPEADDRWKKLTICRILPCGKTFCTLCNPECNNPNFTN